MTLRYCRRCEERTRHDTWSEDDLVGETTVARVFAGLATMGLSEAIREHFKQCLCCGLKTRD